MRKLRYCLLALALGFLWGSPAGGQTTGVTTFQRAGTLLNASTGSQSYALFAGSFRAGDTITCSYYGLVRLSLALQDSTGKVLTDDAGHPIASSFAGAFNPNILIALRTKNTFTLPIPKAETNAILVLRNPEVNGSSANYTLTYPVPLLYLNPPLPAISYGTAIQREPVFAKDPNTGQLIAYFHVGNLGALPLDTVVVNVKVGSSTTFLYTLPKSVGSIPANGLSDWVTLAIPANTTLTTFYLDSTALGLRNLQQIKAFRVLVTQLPVGQ